MMIRLLSIGRDRNDPLQSAVEMYAQRIRRFAEMELWELKEEPLRKNQSVAVAMKKEAVRLRERCVGQCVVLDRTAPARTSEQWAEALQVWQERSLSVTFVVGGPYGLDPEFTQAADARWSLGPLTLPHRIARLVVVEQLYRATTILRSEPYHK